MNIPSLAIAVNDAVQMTFTHLTKPDEANPQVFTTALHEFNADGLDASCLRVGRLVFAVMAHWYPEAFARFPNLRPPCGAQTELNLIAGLIGQSIEHRTTAHIASIELLIDRAIKRDSTAAEQSLMKAWPETKALLAGLENFPPARS